MLSKRNKGIGTLTFLCMTWMLCSIAFPLVLEASIASDPIVNETVSDKISLILFSLTEAINNPTDLNIKVLSVALPPEKETNRFHRAFDNVSQDSRGLNPRIEMSLLGWSRTDGATVQVSFMLENVTVLDTIKVEFSPGPIRFVPGTWKPELAEQRYQEEHWSYKGLSLEFLNSTTNWDSVQAATLPVEEQYCPVISNLDEVLDGIESLVQRSEEMAPFVDGIHQPVIESRGGRSMQSNNLFWPRSLYGSYTRFTEDVSRAEFSNHLIFSRISAMFGMEYNDPWDWLDHRFIQSADADWHRLIGSSQNPGRPSELHWFNDIGSYGVGGLGFKHPCDISYVSMEWYVVDRYNNVVKVYNLNWDTGALTMEDELEPFTDPVDADAARFPMGENPLNDYWEIAVLDRGARNITIFDLSGNLQRTLPSYSTDPTALCFLNNYITHYKMPYLYVVDNGNKRVLGMNTNGMGSPSTTAPGTFQSNSWLSSVSCDAYGNIYVTDKQNCVVYVLRNLELIATFGLGPGTSDDELYYPTMTHVAEGWAYSESGRNVPIVRGDVLIAEVFDNSTGLRRFVLGFDILGHELSYYPQYMPGYGDRVRIDWDVSNTTKSRRRVWANGVLLDEIWDEVNVPGGHYHQYWMGEDDPDSTYYKFEIYVESKYDPGINHTLCDSIYVTRYVNPGPHIIVEETGTIDLTGEIPDWCGVHGNDTGKAWMVYINAYDNWNDSNLTFYWEGSSYMFFAEDTTFDSTWSYFVNDQDSMFFKMFGAPWDVPSGGQYRSMFFLMITDEPYEPSKGYWEYNWLDTLYIYDWFYRLSCQMPCTDDCPKPDHGCPMLYVVMDGERQFINNLLPQAAGGTRDGTDYYVIDIPDEGTVSFVISENENEITRFDQLGVEVLDVQWGMDLILTDRERFCTSTGFLIPPITAITDDGEDITRLLSEKDQLSYVARDPGHIDLEYRVGGDDIALLGPTPPTKAFKKLAPGASNIITLSAQVDGEYVVVQNIYARMTDTKVDLVEMGDYVGIDGILRLRLEWTQEISIDQLPYTQYETVSVPVTKPELVSAFNAIKGDITGLVHEVDGSYAVLNPGEEITLVYEATPAAPLTNKFAVFKAVGRYSNITPDDVILPDRFEFSQYPNPFNPTTTFSFSLPKAEHVKITVYNILGQEVTTLVDRVCEASNHTIEWNGRSGNNVRIASGVYFARFSAGEFNSTKKVMVLK